MRAMFESFMASNGSSSPKPKLLQPPPSSLHFEFFVLSSKQPTRVERWNQTNLGYFDSHLDDKAYDAREVVLVGKDVYYHNVVLFIQCIQNLVTFKGTTLVKNNIAISLRGSALEWYTSELSDFNCDALNNDPGVKSWINTLSHRLKVPTSVALDLLTNEAYSLNNARARRPSAQYVRAIMQHGIGCNIVDVANQLSFAY